MERRRRRKTGSGILLLLCSIIFIAAAAGGSRNSPVPTVPAARAPQTFILCPISLNLEKTATRRIKALEKKGNEAAA